MNDYDDERSFWWQPSPDDRYRNLQDFFGDMPIAVARDYLDLSANPVR